MMPVSPSQLPQLLAFALLVTGAWAPSSHARNGQSTSCNSEISQNIYTEKFLKSLVCPAKGPDLAAEVREDFRRTFPDANAPEVATLVKELFGKKPPFSATQSAGKCKTTDSLCTLSQTMGSEESAMRALLIAKQYGYLFSLSQHETLPGEKEQIWTPKQMQEFHELFQNLPTTFFNLPNLKSIIKVTRASSRAFHKTSPVSDGYYAPGNREISVINCEACPGGEKSPRSILMHELGHAFEHSQNPTAELRMPYVEYSGFSRISGWDDGNPDQHSLVSKYAGEDASEDFAESVKAYLEEGEALGNVSLEKYEFLKTKIYAGQQYPMPGVRSWGTLESSIERLGGVLQAIERCSPPLPLSQTANRAAIHSWVNSCLQRLALEAAKSIADDPLFCRRGGLDAVHQYAAGLLRNKMMIFRGAVTGEPSQKCWSNRDYSFDCLKRELTPMLEKSGVRSKSAQSALFDGILNRRIFDQSANHFLSNINTHRLFLTCLTGIKQIKKNDSAQLTFKTDCRNAAKKFLQTEGYQYASFTEFQVSHDVLSDFLEGRAGLTLQKTFSSDIFGNWASAIDTCPSLDCKELKVQELVIKWLEKSGGHAADIPEGFAKQLLRSVR